MTAKDKINEAKQRLLQSGYKQESIDLASSVSRVQYIHHNQRMKYIEFMADLINHHDKEKLVMPVGPLQPLVMVVGDITDEDDSEVGMPFVGATGHLLTIILNTLGIDRNALYLTNVFKYHTNEPTSEEEINKSIDNLHKEIQLVKPKYVLCMGGFTLKALTKNKEIKLSDAKGKFINGKEMSVFSTIHPKTLLNENVLKNPEQVTAIKKEIFSHFQTFFNEVKQKHPEWAYDFVLNKK